MPYKKFVKGHKKLGGRKKGTPNKFTTLKDAFIGAFQDVGGQEALAKFAASRKGKKAFYNMVSGMLPKDVQVSGPNGQALPASPPIIIFTDNESKDEPKA